jgi:hypothetical protein
MKMTAYQYAGMTTSLCMFASIDLSDVDPVLLEQLAELLAEAALNVARARRETGVESDAEQYEQTHGEPPF